MVDFSQHLEFRVLKWNYVARIHVWEPGSPDSRVVQNRTETDNPNRKNLLVYQ
uniref:Uncharacterized protein n=1 Tax=Solanum tuberosum TaxID=4113 RepID=M1DVE9_SOLTU